MSEVTFMSARKFVKLSNPVDGVQVVSISKHFSARFGAYSEKGAMVVPVMFCNIVEDTKEEDVLKMLDEKNEKAASLLSGIWHLMKGQGQGNVGSLVVSGDPNIFFAIDIFGVLCILYIYWDTRKCGWGISAYEIGENEEEEGVIRKISFGARIFKGQ